MLAINVYFSTFRINSGKFDSIEKREKSGRQYSVKNGKPEEKPWSI